MLCTLMRLQLVTCGFGPDERARQFGPWHDTSLVLQCLHTSVPEHLMGAVLNGALVGLCKDGTDGSAGTQHHPGFNYYWP